MDYKEVAVHPPQEGQSLEEYIQSFTVAELKKIKRDPQLLTKFSAFLLEISKKSEKKEDNLEKLWNIIKQRNNLDGLLRIIRKWEGKRNNLLKSLSEYEKQISENCNLTNLRRLACSTIDIVGTVGAELMRDNQPNYANFAVNAATGFGIMGCMAPRFEKRALEIILEDLCNLIKEDQESFESIKIWYEQTTDLQELFKKVFQFDITCGVGSELYEIVKRNDADSTPVKLLTAFLSSLKEDDIKSLQNGESLKTFINLIKNKEFRELTKWMYRQQLQFTVEAFQVFLQFQYEPIQELLKPYVPILGKIRGREVPVLFWGHIAVNAITVYQSISSLWKPETPKIVSNMRQLRKDLKSELDSLQHLADFVEIRMRSEE